MVRDAQRNGKISLPTDQRRVRAMGAGSLRLLPLAMTVRSMSGPNLLKRRTPADLEVSERTITSCTVVAILSLALLASSDV